MRLLGIDYGSKRVGIAISDVDAGFAIPTSVIKNQGDIEKLLKEVIELATKNSIKEIVIGRGGSGLEDIKRMVLGMLFEPKKDKKNQPRVELKVEPVKDPNLSAFLVASNISDQLIRRMPFRRIMKQSIEKVMGSGAKGVRIVLAGRINGAEIGRRERLQVGKVSLSTIREDIDYASVPALTKSGYIGVKVWIDRG
jgi:small subunit ribosomal protein S3